MLRAVQLHLVDLLQSGQLALFIKMGGRSRILNNEVESFYSGFVKVISYGKEEKKDYSITKTT